MPGQQGMGSGAGPAGDGPAGHGPAEHAGPAAGMAGQRAWGARGMAASRAWASRAWQGQQGMPASGGGASTVGQHGMAAAGRGGPAGHGPAGHARPAAAPSMPPAVVPGFAGPAQRMPCPAPRGSRPARAGEPAAVRRADRRDIPRPGPGCAVWPGRCRPAADDRTCRVPGQSMPGQSMRDTRDRPCHSPQAMPGGQGLQGPPRAYQQGPYGVLPSEQMMPGQFPSAPAGQQEGAGSAYVPPQSPYGGQQAAPAHSCPTPGQALPLGGRGAGRARRGL